MVKAAGIEIPAGGIGQLKPLGGALFGPALTAGDATLEKLIGKFRATATDEEIDEIHKKVTGNIASGIIDALSSEKFKHGLTKQVVDKIPVVPGQ